MTTQEIAEKIIAYINEGKNIQAEEELYADDVVSVEQDGRIATGKEAIIAKTKAAFENVEEWFGGGVAKAYVAADSFLLNIEMDMKPKGGERTFVSEFGYYEVKDGKIVRETFFMQPLEK